MANFMDRLLNLFLKTIDSFLCPQNLVSTETRMHARIIVFTFLFWAFLNGLMAVYAIFTVQPLALPLLIYSLIINISFAFLIKKSFSPQKVYLVYMGLFLSLQLLEAAFLEDADPLAFITLLILTCLLITDVKRRFISIAAIAATTCLSFLFLSQREGHHFWPFTLPPEPALSLVVLSTVSYLVIFSMASKFKSIAQSELDMEILWQERMKRIEDASSMTKAMRRMSIGPVEEIGKDLERLKKHFDHSTLDDLHDQIEKLLLISKAFGYVRRSQSGEEPLPVSLDPFLAQLVVLLSANVQDESS